MNKQRCFNIAFNGVLSQGALAISGGTRGCCRYRFNGLQCNLGHLISNTDYSIALENRSAHSLLYKKGIGFEPKLIKKLRIKSVDDIDFMQDLQSAHDNADSIEDYKARMQEVACDWFLNCPEGLNG